MFLKKIPKINENACADIMKRVKDVCLEKLNINLSKDLRLVGQVSVTEP